MIRLSREQVRAVDRIAIEEYGIPGIVLMENAARSAVEAIVHRYGSPVGKEIAIVCGNGNNGGDGYAIARHLQNRGGKVTIYRVWPGKLSADAQFNADITAKMEIPISDSIHGDLFEPWITIDAVFGTGLTTPPRDSMNHYMNEMNVFGKRVVAIDIPSGLDCDTGNPVGAIEHGWSDQALVVVADLTVTFVAEKLGFANPRSRHYTGDIVVGDIGCPREIIDRVLREIPSPQS